MSGKLPPPDKLRIQITDGLKAEILEKIPCVHLCGKKIGQILGFLLPPTGTGSDQDYVHDCNDAHICEDGWAFAVHVSKDGLMRVQTRQVGFAWPPRDADVDYIVGVYDEYSFGSVCEYLQRIVNDLHRPPGDVVRDLCSEITNLRFRPDYTEMSRSFIDDLREILSEARRLSHMI